jgi:hypothetical protein
MSLSHELILQPNFGLFLGLGMMLMMNEMKMVIEVPSWNMGPHEEESNICS